MSSVLPGGTARSHLTLAGGATTTPLRDSLRQTIRVGAYVVGRHLKGVRRYPLVLMLEPLFRCNLACAGCGKIDYPDPILNQRMSVADATAPVPPLHSGPVGVAY